MGIIQDLGTVFIANATLALLSLLSVVIFIPLYGVTPYGQFALFQAIVVILKIVGDAGINNAVEKRVSGRNPKNVVVTAGALKLCLFIVVSAGVFVLRPLINDYLGATMAVYLIPALFLRELSYLLLAVLRGELRIATSIWLTALHRLVFLLFGVGLVFIEALGPVSLAVSYIVGWVPVAFVSLSLIETSIGIPTLSSAESIFSFSKYDFISSIIGSSTYDWLDVLLIGAFLSPAHVSAYEAAWRLAGSVLLVSQAIGFTTFPNVSQLDTGNSLDEFESIFPHLLTGAVLVVPPAIVGSFILGPELLTLLFSSETKIAAAALVVLLIGKIPESINNLVGRALLGLGLPRLTAMSSVVFVVVNLILNTILIPMFGLVGAAAATALAIGVNTGMNTWYLALNVNLSVSWKQLGQILFATFVMGIILISIQSIYTSTLMYRIITSVLVSVIVYFAVLLVFPSFRNPIEKRSGRLT